MLWGRFSPVACKLCTKCFLLHHFLCIAAEIQHTSDHQSQRALAYVARWPIFQTLNITFGPSDLHMFAEDYCPKWPEWPCNGARLNHQGPKATLPEAWTRHLAVGRGGSGPLEIWSGQEQHGRTGHIQRDNQLYQPFDEFLVIPCWVPVTAALRRLANTMILHTVQNSMSATERTQVMGAGPHWDAVH